MSTTYYLAIADRHRGEATWFVLPPLSRCHIGRATFSDIMRQAKDAVATADAYMEQEDEKLPPSIEDDATPDCDRTPYHDPRALLVTVDVAGCALGVNVSLDEGLLARIDDVSKRSCLSRSALLARGARMVITDETTG